MGLISNPSQTLCPWFDSKKWYSKSTFKLFFNLYSCHHLEVLWASVTKYQNFVESVKHTFLVHLSPNTKHESTIIFGIALRGNIMMICSTKFLALHTASTNKKFEDYLKFKASISDVVGFTCDYLLWFKMKNRKNKIRK